jgi:hypothetical protein
MGQLSERKAARLARRPERRRPDGPRGVVARLGPVRACLEHRFATEVELGPSGPVLAGEYDIRIE